MFRVIGRMGAGVVGALVIGAVGIGLAAGPTEGPVAPR